MSRLAVTKESLYKQGRFCIIESNSDMSIKGIQDDIEYDLVIDRHFEEYESLNYTEGLFILSYDDVGNPSSTILDGSTTPLIVKTPKWETPEYLWGTVGVGTINGIELLYTLYNSEYHYEVIGAYSDLEGTVPISNFNMLETSVLETWFSTDTNYLSHVLCIKYNNTEPIMSVRVKASIKPEKLKIIVNLNNNWEITTSALKNEHSISLPKNDYIILNSFSNYNIDNSTSTMTITFENATAGENLELYVMNRGETNWDYPTLTFNNNSEPFKTVSTDWYTYTQTLIEGTNTLTITYQKDGSVSKKIDRAFLAIPSKWMS